MSSGVMGGLLAGLNVPQRTIVSTLAEPVFVAAGAGSGKTFTLTRRIVWALSPGSGEGGAPFLDSLDQALVITFTNKAAGEIRERVRGALRQAGLAEAALTVDEAWISTIHGMCSRILRRHALELGLAPDFAMLGQHRCDELMDAAVETALAEARRDDAYAELMRVFPARGHALRGDAESSVAGMAKRLVSLAGSMADGFDALRFPGKGESAHELVAAAARAFGSFCGQGPGRKASDNQLADLERLRGELARMEEWLAGSPSSQTFDSAELLLRDVKKPDGRYWRAKDVKERKDEACRALADAQAGVSLGHAHALVPALVAFARRVEELYREGKAAAGGLDNDDLLSETLRAFRERPAIAERYANQFRLVMVDEFQDTNAQQVEMIKWLAGPGACRLATVGDAQQSIYRFRGADVEVFERRAEELGDEGCTRMDDNFRSHDDVLRLVAHVCGEGPEPLIPGFMDLRAARRGEPKHPYVAAGTLPRVFVEYESLSCPGTMGLPPMCDQIADRLAQIRDAGQPVGDMALLLGKMSRADAYVQALRDRGLDCVVAGGSTFSQAPEVRVVASLLHVLANPKDTSLGPYPVLSSEMFGLDSDDLLLLGSRDQLVRDPLTGEQVPSGVPGKRSIDSALTDERLETFRDAAPSGRLVAARACLRRAWERMGSLPVADVVLACVRESGWLERLEDAGVEGLARAANVLAAVRHVRELTEEMGLGPARAAWEFDHWLDVAKEGPAALSGGSSQAVRIMTVHASKGLQFPVVAVAELEPRSPSADALVSATMGDEVVCSLVPPGFKMPELGADEDAPCDASDCRDLLDWRRLVCDREVEGTYAEQARLLYVALTRAEEALVLGVAVRCSKSAELKPRFGAEVVARLTGGLEAGAGERRMSYGGSEPALVRHVALRVAGGRGEPRTVEVDSGGTLVVSDLARTLSMVKADLAEGDGAALAESVASGGCSQASEGFALFEPEPEPSAAVSSWSPHEGIYSYSAIARVERPRPDVPLAAPEAELEGPERGDDSDRATVLGSAFHEVAQSMIEAAGTLAEDRVDAICRAWGCSRSQRRRLDAAIERWTGSVVRPEALSREHVLAEVPFCVSDPSDYGDYLEGAIDLLAYDNLPQGGADAPALVIDYKTGDRGLSCEQIAGRHELQAKLYARVLRARGFAPVTCKFVCVEVDDPDAPGEPLVVTYEL